MVRPNDFGSTKQNTKTAGLSADQAEEGRLANYRPSAKLERICFTLWRIMDSEGSLFH